MSLCIAPVQLSKLRRVPCNRCANCRAARVSALSTRILLELSAHPWPFFLTGTFKPEAYPESRDRLRSIVYQVKKAVGERAFYVAERGEHTGRMHVHALMLSDRASAGDAFADYWSRRFGAVKVKPASPGAVRYLTQYLVKSAADVEADANHPDGLGREFAVYPRPAIGSEVVPFLIRRWIESGTLAQSLAAFSDVPSTMLLDGRIVAIPRPLRVAARKALGLPTSDPSRDAARQDVERIRLSHAGLQSQLARARDVAYRRNTDRERRALYSRYGIAGVNAIKADRLSKAQEAQIEASLYGYKRRDK